MENTFVGGICLFEGNECRKKRECARGKRNENNKKE